MELQVKLNSIGTTPVLIPDGDFGNMTLTAVKSFQESHGLTADGVAGPLTWTSLDGVAAPLGVGGSQTAATPAAGTDLPGLAPVSFGGGAKSNQPQPDGTPQPSSRVKPADAGVQGPSWVNVNNPTGLIGQIFFPTDVFTLDDQDLRELQEVIDAYPAKLNVKRVAFQFHGFADHRFTKEHNDELSKNRGESVKNFIQEGLFSHKNFAPTVIAHGVHAFSKDFPATSEQLAGFRRVDILAEPFLTTPPKQKPQGPGPQRSTSWEARMLFGAGTSIGPLGFETFEMEIRDLTNNLQMFFRYKGAALSPGLPASFSEGTDFVKFATNFAFRLREFEGFARHSAAVFALGGGLSADVVTLSGPQHQVGADTVTLEFAGFSNFGVLGRGASISLGTLTPTSEARPL